MEQEILKITSNNGDVRVETKGDIVDIIHALAVVACQSISFKAILKSAIDLSSLDELSETYEEISLDETHFKKMKTKGDA